VPYEGNDAWVEGTLAKMKECLDADNPPEPAPDCEHCRYIEKAKAV
jgi:hypothetical protein